MARFKEIADDDHSYGANADEDIQEFLLKSGKHLLFCEEIRKEIVTPNSNPALVKPLYRGIEVREQNWVTIPIRVRTNAMETAKNLLAPFSGEIGYEYY